MKLQIKIFLMVLSTLLGKEILYAQVAQNHEEKEYPNIPISPSPNAYEMAKYIDFPTLDNYGVVPISVPIFSIKEKDMEHTIELNYHASGIKVAQEATSVGLGWNLNAGGVITRSIRDLADDEETTYNVRRQYHNSTGYHRDITTDHGWLIKPDRIKNFPELTSDALYSNYKDRYALPWNTSGDINAGLALNALNDRGYDRFDCEPDIFYLSVNDINLKFVFGFDGLPKLINSNQKVVINHFFEAANKKIKTFEVIDQKGYRYYFGENFKEVTTVSSVFHQTAIPDLKIDNFMQSISMDGKLLDEFTLSKTCTTAWFLYKIKSPFGNEITFDYEAKNGIKMSLRGNLYQTTKPNVGESNLVFRNTWNTVKSIDHIINTYTLKDIIFATGRVHFTTESSTDIENGFRIYSIELFSGSNVINTCLFSYNYMNNTSTYKSKRLMLSSITMNEGQYSFDYYPGNLPSKDSDLQDFWGYYSTKSSGLIPQIYVYKDLSIENKYRCYPIPGKTSITIPGSDRSCDTNNIKTGTLWKITYPTKGYTVFNFQPNQYYDEVSNTNIDGGGLRIESIEKHDNSANNNALLLKENYSYLKLDGNSSGILINQLAFATPTNYTFIPSSTFPTAKYAWECTGSEWTEAKKYEYFTVRSSNNFFPLTCMDGHQIGYTNVTIEQAGNGKTEKEYFPPRNFISNASMVYSTPVNGCKTFYETTMPNIIWPRAGIKTTYEARCQLYAEQVWENGQLVYKDNYYWHYTSTSGANYDSKDACEQYEGPINLTVEKDLDYYGGGYMGAFTASGYINSNFGIQNYDVFGLSLYRFRIQKVDNIIFDGILYDNSYKYINYNVFDWDNVQQSGKNIYPFPPLSDNVNDALTYNLIKNELVYKNGETTPCLEKYYDYSLYKTGTENEQVFGIVSNNHFAVSKGLKANIWDALGGQDSGFGKTYFLGNVYNNYCLPKAWSKYNYNVNSVALLTQVRTVEKFNGQAVEKIENFEYNNNFLVKKEKLASNSLNKSVSTNYYYPTDSPLPADIQTNGSTISKMNTGNMISFILKEEKMLNETSFVSGQINNYQILPNVNIVIPLDIRIAQTDRTYVPELVYNEFDNKGNVISATGKDGIMTSYLWSYNQTLPVAKITNGKFSVDPALSQAAYIGFESNDMTNSQANDYWSLNHTGHSFTSDAKAGRYAWKMTSQDPYGPTRSVKPASSTSIYTFSGWAKTPASFSGECYFVLCADGTGSAGYKTVPITNTDGKWKYFEVTLDLSKVNMSLSTISGYPWLKSGAEVTVDELRLHPADSQMETYSYLPMIGMKSKTDFKSITTTFDYDSFRRLSEIKNDDGKVLKKYKYHYSGNN